MKIQENAAKTIVMFFKYPWVFIFGALISVILSGATLGILAPCLWLGMGEMFRMARDGKKPTYDALFVHLDKAIMLAVLGFILAVSAGIGMVLIVPGIMIAALWMYSGYYMAYKGTGIMDSFKLSSAAVNKNNLMTHIMLIIGLWLIMAVGAQLVIGIFVAYPLCAGFMMFLFEEVEGK